jgi:hypothetical protein
MSIEEKEDWGCGFKGDIVKVAAHNEGGRGALEEGQHEFIMEMLSAFLFCTLDGRPLYSDQILKASSYICNGRSGCHAIPVERFDAYIVFDPSTIEDQGCELSEQADDCLIQW